MNWNNASPTSNIIKLGMELSMSRALYRQYLQKSSPQAGCVWPIDLGEIKADGQPALEDHQIQIHSLRPLEPYFNSGKLQSQYTSEPAEDPHTHKVEPERMG